MRVLELREPFGVESMAFSTRPDPTPGPRQLLIQLKALSLNYRDHLVVGGIGRRRRALAPDRRGSGDPSLRGAYRMERGG